jgi:ABC-type sugar transport system substrate-binding protein
MAIVWERSIGRVADVSQRLLGLVLSIACASLTGCDSDQGAPPTGLPVPPTSAAQVDDDGSVPFVALIVPRTGLVDATVWEQLARLAAPDAGALAEVIKSEKGHQAESVRRSVQRGASALILVSPDESEPELVSALREARESTLATRHRPLPILLGLKGLDIGSDHLPVVRFESIDDSARELVAATLEDARKAGEPEHPKAVILYNGPYDFEGQARIDAVRKALTEAKVTLLPDAAFQGFMAEAGEALNASLEAEPDVAIVIATDDQGGRAAATVRDKLEKSQHRFVLGVIGPARELDRLAEFNIVSGLVLRDSELLARKALSEVLKWTRGGAVSTEDIVVPAPFKRSTGPEVPGFAPKDVANPPKPLNAKSGLPPPQA